MKARRFLSMLLVLMLAGSGAAWAHGVRGHVGVYLGPTWGPGWGYPPPYYYPPQVVVVPPSQPPVYIERQDEAVPHSEAQQYWYFCKSAKGYYPYIKECPEGWHKVLPQPEK
jgi:hypothetical protein